MATKQYYLGKRGKIHGPLDQAEMDRLQASGEIGQYTFIWDFDSKQWKTIEEPPNSPFGEPVSKRGAKVNWDQLQVLCHNFVSVVGGVVAQVTDLGCELIATGHADAPSFAPASAVVMNLMDTERGSAVNVKATVLNIERRDGRWVYRIKWEVRPEF